MYPLEYTFLLFAIDKSGNVGINTNTEKVQETYEKPRYLLGQKYHRKESTAFITDRIASENSESLLGIKPRGILMLKIYKPTLLSIGRNLFLLEPIH